MAILAGEYVCSQCEWIFEVTEKEEDWDTTDDTPHCPSCGESKFVYDETIRDDD